MLPLFTWAAVVCFAAVVLTLFYAVSAPNWDVPLYTALMAGVALLPVCLLVRFLFGCRTLQVEHAGVVVADYLWGRCLRRRVFQAVEMRHFDWEADTSDGGWTLRLLIQRYPSARPSFLTVLHTDNPYLMAAVWHDFELHYPGSGLREAPPAAAVPYPRPSRLAGGIMLLVSALSAWGTRDFLIRPLYLCAKGQVTPAVVQQVVWDSPRPGSTYHLLCQPDGSQKARLGITAYEQSPYIPQVGSRCEILWAADADYCCSPAAVVPFVLPLPLAALELLLLGGGGWMLYTSRRKDR